MKINESILKAIKQSICESSKDNYPKVLKQKITFASSVDGTNDADIAETTACEYRNMKPDVLAYSVFGADSDVIDEFFGDSYGSDVHFHNEDNIRAVIRKIILDEGEVHTIIGDITCELGDALILAVFDINPLQNGIDYKHPALKDIAKKIKTKLTKDELKEVSDFVKTFNVKGLSEYVDNLLGV